MTLPTIPDSEKIVSNYLRDHADVAAIVGRRVVGKTPDRTTDPWVRVTQLDAEAVPLSTTDHLVAYLVQFDCYAGKELGQPQANLLARTVRAALHVMTSTVHDGAVVTSVRFSGMPRIPDTDFEPARERVILTATVHMHTDA